MCEKNGNAQTCMKILCTDTFIEKGDDFMDSIEEISISKLAAIVTNGSIFKTSNNSIWERILSTSGQSILYKQYEHNLKPYIYNGTWENPNPQFGEFYSAVNKILKSIYNHRRSFEELYLVIAAMVNEFEIEDVLLESFAKENFTGAFRLNSDMFFKKLDEMSSGLAMEMIIINSKSDFIDLRKVLQVLNLDFEYGNQKLLIKSVTNQGSAVLERDNSILLEWLKMKSPRVAELYIEALKNYLAGNAVSCISTCRNIIVGICEDSKDDETKWLKGLQKISTDTYIENVQVPMHIINNKANAILGIENQGFKFVRFKLIYQLYSLASDLGAHTSEGPMINGIVYTERSTLEDALWILRMTEDFLLWIKYSEND